MFCGFLRVFFPCFVLFCFKAAHAGYGSSQARGGIGAIAAGLYTATTRWDPSHDCDLYHRSRQHWILNPLSKAKDGTHIFMDISQVLNSLSHNGNSFPVFFIGLWFAWASDVTPGLWYQNVNSFSLLIRKWSVQGEGRNARREEW